MFEIESKDYKENEFGIVIDNFYRSPKKVQELLLTLDPRPHKFDCFPSHNGKYFKDMRHELYSSHITPVYNFLSKFSKQNPLGNGGFKRINSNVYRMKKDPFNTYDTHYWWPHFDMGYTAILYLNEEDDSGTNLYRSCDEEEEAKLQVMEHYEPWRPKEKYDLLHTFEPKFNRLVMFNGHKYCHGMNITSDLFTGKDARLNQVFFFDGEFT